MNRITYDERDDTLVDEIVLSGVDLHLEMLDRGLAHLRVTSPGRSFAIDIAARRDTLTVRPVDQEGDWTTEEQP